MPPCTPPSTSSCCHHLLLSAKPGEQRGSFPQSHAWERLTVSLRSSLSLSFSTRAHSATRDCVHATCSTISRAHCLWPSCDGIPCNAIIMIYHNNKFNCALTMQTQQLHNMTQNLLQHCCSMAGSPIEGLAGTISTNTFSTSSPLPFLSYVFLPSKCNDNHPSRVTM
jgi:hypothetical protein